MTTSVWQDCYNDSWKGLVKETTEPGLFGDVTKRKERKSFFRRLAERKGSPRIDWEEVLWCRKETS